MNKEEFLAAVGQRLSLLPKDEVRSRLDYFAECIDDRIEDGMTETEAVAALGEPQQAAENVLLDMPLQLLMKGRKRPTLKGWHIVLIVIGSVVWLPLGLAAAGVLLAVLGTAVAILFSLCAAVLALIFGGVLRLVSGISSVFSSDASAVGAIGVALAAMGLGVLLFYAVKCLFGVCIKGVKALVLSIKKAVLKKRLAK